MNYYIQGDAAKAEQIKAAFEKLGYEKVNVIHIGDYANERLFFFTENGKVRSTLKDCGIVHIIKTHPDYKELELPKPHYDIKNFKPFDKVLGRDYDEGVWICDLYSYYYKGDNKMGVDNAFVCVGDSHLQCIPYDGNEHLLGTTDMCPEEYINW